MGGGLLNLISKGSEDIILTGNPCISFFKHVYKKYTNFGNQYFRIDYDGLRNIDYDNETEITFQIPRYADLLGESYIVLNIPDIYSQPPIWNNKYCPKFKWIRDLGYNMIKKVSISIGGQLINEFSGEYFINLRDREYNSDKTDKINNMTGNIPDLYDPASKYNGVYPNSFKSTDFEPSIRGRKLYIPIDCWFGQDSYMNIPLISLQYQIMHIKVLFRPIKELYVVSNQLNDEYIDNYLFNEFPTYHNINFIINSDGEDLDIILGNLKGQIIDTIDDNDEINLQQSNTTLDILFKNYTDSILSIINGENIYTNEQTTENTGNKQVVFYKKYNIENTKYYKIFFYIDFLHLSSKINKAGNIQTQYNDIINELKNIIKDANNVNTNSISFFYSTNTPRDIMSDSANNNEIPHNVFYSNSSNNRYLLQKIITNKTKHEKYVAPEYLSINKLDDANNQYSTNDLIGTTSIDIDYFTLDNLSNILNNSWNADIHIISKYVFLDEQERTKFAKLQQSYLIKTIYEEEFHSLLVPNTIKINSKDLVINYTWAFRRNDAFIRNEWSNYTNWEYTDTPNSLLTNTNDGVNFPFFLTPYIGAGSNNNNNKKNILQSLSVLVDGKMRENLFEQGVFNHLEKYLKCVGRGKEGQYFYSFALNNSPNDLQPSGCMNLSRYNDILFQFTLIDTPDDPNFDPSKATTLQFQQRPNGSAPICVSTTTKKDDNKLYSFDMRTFQERYNVLIFKSGMANLLYSK